MMLQTFQQKLKEMVMSMLLMEESGGHQESWIQDVK
jgi:hypothetical protein